MKKILCIVLPVVILIGATALLIFSTKPKIVYAKTITANTQEIKMEVGEIFELSSKIVTIEPANYTERIYFSTDSSFAEVDLFSGQLEAKQVGSCNLIVSASCDNENLIFTKIVLTITEQLVYPTSVTLTTNNLQLYVGQAESLPISVVGTHNVLPIIELENGCVSYNSKTQMLTAIKSGADKLTIKFPMSKTEYQVLQIDINVLSKSISEQDVTIDMSTQEYIILEYSTLNNKQDTTITVEVGADVVQVIEQEYKHLLVIPLKTGVAKIVIDSPSQKIVYNINVI